MTPFSAIYTIFDQDLNGSISLSDIMLAFTHFDENGDFSISSSELDAILYD